MLGLICVVITSALTAATIVPIYHAIRDIQLASPISAELTNDPQQTQTLNRNIERIAERLQVDQNALKEAIDLAQAQEKTESEDSNTVEQRRKDALNHLLWVSLSVVGIYALKYWFTRGSVYYMSKASTLLANDLRERIFSRLQHLPIAYFNRSRAGAIQSVLTNDTNVYTNAVSVVRDSIDGPIKIVSGLIAVFIIQPTLALVAALFVPVIALVVQMNARKMKQAQAKVQEDLAELQAFTNEAIQGTRVIKAFGAESRILDAFRSRVNQFYNSQMTAVRRQSSLKPLVEFVGAVALSTIIYICGWLAFRAEIDIAKVTALVYTLDMVNQGWRSLGYVRNTIAQVEAASDRIYNEVLSVPLEQENEDGQTIPNLKGEICFENVSFTYPDGTPALQNVTFTIPPGTSLALVGPSGAGKSTIADLLLRFYNPTEGRVTIDGIDVRDLKCSWLRESIGVVPQTTFLFAGSIADNISLAMPSVTEAELEEAATAAHALPFINRLPERFQAQLGEQGAGLSGGERQRLAIARALVRKPAILLLDEATSNLDAESEKVVTDALEEIMHTRTTLFIAHRLTTAARADKILVLRRGQVLETGSHKELMDKNGAYAAMYRAFNNGLVDGEL